MDFASDNASGASPEVMAAIVAANAGFAPAYGADPWTQAAERRIADVFERECAVFLVATGTASNALALASLTPPWGAAFCHPDSHVMGDECGAPEFFSAGAKLVPVGGEGGKIDAGALREALDAFPRGVAKLVQPSALSLSQATESGSLYTPDEVAGLAGLAHERGVGVHMDGARFANALVALGCTPAQLTWRAGVDVLSLGASKNGTLACEAVVIFDPARAQDLVFRRKRSGHTLSKGRLLGAQMEAWLRDGHWLALARHANDCAAQLAAGLRDAPGVRTPWPTAVNEVFAVLPGAVDAALRAAGARYYDWPARRLPAALAPRGAERFVRLVTSFATSPQDVARFVEIAAGAGKD
ncbi:MAG: Threonine aldolase [Hyphomicrobiales bacterium]|nr:Threonine aldolase [Hyphomicrobiales bacterium]